MGVADPTALVLVLALLAGAIGAALVRRGRSGLGALVATLVAGALAWAAGSEPAAPPALAACALGAGASLLLPGLGLERFRRRTFGAAFERIHAGGQGEARLPARAARLRPSRLLDPADRLRLESAVHDAEAKSGAAIAVALVRRCSAYEAAGWRAAAWLAALLAAAAAAFAPSSRLTLAAAATGLAAGHLLARSARVRRFFVAESELAERASQAAAAAFASAGLAGAGVLLFAALFERRAIVLAGERHPCGDWDEVAAVAARGVGAGRALEGLLAALERALPTPPRSAEPASPAARPHPVRVED